MKKILMAAVAVSAIGAGSANALSLNAGASFVGYTNSASAPINLNQSPTLAGFYDPFTIANEYNLNSATVVPVKLSLDLTNNLAAGTQFIVTYTVTGGTFDPSFTTASLGVGATSAAAGGATQSYDATPVVSADVNAIQQGPTNSLTAPTSVSFIIPVVATPVANLKGISFKAGIKPSGKADVTVSAVVTYLNSPTITYDGGATAPVTIIDFRDGLAFSATDPVGGTSTTTFGNATFTNASGFKKFSGTSGDTLTAPIATKIRFTAATAPTGDKGVFVDFGATSAAPTLMTTARILSATLNVAGDLTVQKLLLGTSQTADSATTPGVITASAINLSVIQGATGNTLSLVAPGTTAGVESSYSITPVLTLDSGLLPLTYSAKSVSSTAYEGTSIFAPWVGDGTNGIGHVIRIANKSTSAAVSSVSAFLLNPYTVVAAGGTVLQTAACPLGSIAAKTELLVDSAALTKCFGAFKRSDVKFVIQGTSSITAKMRSTSPNGTTVESSLGSLVATN